MNKLPKRYLSYSLKLCLLLMACMPLIHRAAEQRPTQASVKSVLQRVADWQIEHLRDDYGRRWESNNRLDAWTYGALYVGMHKWAEMADSDKYFDFLVGIGEENDWDLGPDRYYADDQIVGQLYIELYRKYGEEKMIEKTRQRTKWILKNPSQQPINLSNYDYTERWTWCDALFMAPPVWAMLANETGNDAYRDFMFEEYKATYDHLYDPETNLFFRDEHFIDRRDHGRKVFWSRGNGWVFGGLALIIPELPEGEQRDWFIDLYLEMAPAVAELQTPEGHWAMSLLAADAYPTPETSGTAFFTYGLAWGMNQGLLDESTYLPVVMKGWNTLVSHVTEDGMLGYVQPIGAAPGEAWPDRTEVYGTGAFLAAGSEVYELVAPAPVDMSQKTFLEDAGWCWYQDPRAIIANGKLIVGGIDGQNGDVRVGVYDLKEGKNLGSVVLHPRFERDDHDAPAFYLRPDGRALAVYAKHATDRLHYYRISEPDNYLEWSEEQTFAHNYTGGWGVTYMNLFSMEDEGILYNFFRDGENINPSFITSADHGDTWGNRTHFITDELGWQRPYARYLQVDPNTIGVSFTDAHPRQYGNNLYYAKFRDGTFYRADGSRIKDLSEGPLKPSEATRIYQGSESNHKPQGFESVPYSAWTNAMASDSEGDPHLGYTLYLSNDDHRYRIASWDGRQWLDKEIAYGGKCLYTAESSYTGLFALDPEYPYRVAISTDVDPTTGRDTGGKHEIYAGYVGPNMRLGDIKWNALTENSNVRNIRPIIVANEGYKVLVWMRGPYATYTDYDTDIVGIVLNRP